MTMTTTNDLAYELGQRAAARRNAVMAKTKELSASPELRVVAVILLVLALWGVAIATFGYPALIVPMLALVPTMFVVLLLITVGK